MSQIIKQTHGPDYIENHLGGCSVGGDGGTYYPIMWEYIINKYKIRSVLDVGCGRGFSSKFFESSGCNILGIDGCKAAVENSLIPNKVRLIDYEISSGVNENETFDLCWSCEFVEHVWEKFIPNFVNDFKKCKYLAMTFAEPGQTGHHHVNENTEKYWIKILEKYEFKFLEEDTNILREKAYLDKLEREKDINVPHFNPHFVKRGLFFINKKYDSV